MSLMALDLMDLTPFVAVPGVSGLSIPRPPFRSLELRDKTAK